MSFSPTLTHADHARRYALAFLNEIATFGRCCEAAEIVRAYCHRQSLKENPHFHAVFEAALIDLAFNAEIEACGDGMWKACTKGGT